MMIVQQGAETAQPTSGPSTGDAPAAGRPGGTSDMYDLLVVGRGAAARAAAALARRRGARVALVPWSSEPGGGRARTAACRARLAQLAQRLFDTVGSPGSHRGGGEHELRDVPPRADWEDDLRAAAFKEESFDRAELFCAQLQAGSEATDEPALRELAGSGVTVAQGGAEFFAPDALLAGDSMLRFRRAVLALEAASAALALPGCEEALPLSECTLPKLESLPRQVAVVGADAEACAWAQILARFGSEVHLVSAEPALLPQSDREAADLVRRQLADERVRLHLGCPDLLLGKMGSRRTLVIVCDGRQEMLMVDEILVGRQKQLLLEDLKLDAAGVAHNTAGIVVDPFLQTTNPRIFLAGEACGRPWLDDEAARASAAVAVSNALRLGPAWLTRLLGGAGPAWLCGARFQAARLPRCVHLDPQVIEIGPPVQDLADADRPLRWHRVEPSAQRELLKVAVDARSNRIVAITAVARDAAQWIAPLVLLMARGLPLGALEDLVPCGSVRVAALRRMSQTPAPAASHAPHACGG